MAKYENESVTQCDQQHSLAPYQQREPESSQRDTKMQNNKTESVPQSSQRSQTQQQVYTKMEVSCDGTSSNNTMQTKIQKQNEMKIEFEKSVYSYNKDGGSVQEISQRYNKAQLLGKVYQNQSDEMSQRSGGSHFQSKDKLESLQLKNSSRVSNATQEAVLAAVNNIAPIEELQIIEEASPQLRKDETQNTETGEKANDGYSIMTSQISEPIIIIKQATLRENASDAIQKKDSQDFKLEKFPTMNEEEKKKSEGKNLIQENHYKDDLSKFYQKSKQNREQRIDLTKLVQEDQPQQLLDHRNSKDSNINQELKTSQQSLSVRLDASECKKISSRNSPRDGSFDEDLHDSQMRNSKKYVQIFDNLNFAEQSQKSSISLDQQKMSNQDIGTQDINAIKFINEQEQEEKAEDYENEQFEASQYTAKQSGRPHHNQSVSKNIAQAMDEQREFQSRSIQVQLNDSRQQVYQDEPKLQPASKRHSHQSKQTVERIYDVVTHTDKPNELDIEIKELVQKTNDSQLHSYRQSHHQSLDRNVKDKQGDESKSGSIRKNSKFQIKKLRFQYINNKKDASNETQQKSASKVNMKNRTNAQVQPQQKSAKSSPRKQANQSQSSNRNKSQQLKGSQMRLKILDQINQSRQQFYTSFFTQKSGNTSNHMHIMNILRENQDKLAQQANEVYSRYDLNFSGITKQQILDEPIEELDKKIQLNLRKKAMRQKMIQLQRVHYLYQNSRNFASNTETLQQHFTENQISSRPFTNEDKKQTPMHIQFSEFSSDGMAPFGYPLSSMSRNHYEQGSAQTHYMKKRTQLFDIADEQSNSLMNMRTIAKPNMKSQYHINTDKDSSRLIEQGFSNFQRPMTNMTNTKTKNTLASRVNRETCKSHGKYKANKLIHPGLQPKTHIQDQLNWSVRGRPVKQYMNIIKGEISQDNQRSSPFHQNEPNYARDKLFNQTFQDFNKQDPPQFKTNEKYYYNKRMSPEQQEEYSNLISYREQSHDDSQHRRRESVTIDWADTEIYRKSKTEDLTTFNKERNLKYFTIEEIDHLMQQIQERQCDYDIPEILLPIINKALATLECLYQPMNLLRKYQRLRDRYQDTPTIESTLGILIRTKLSILARKALFNSLKQIRRFESLLRELKDLINQSLDLKLEEAAKVANLQSMSWDFFHFTEILIKNIQELKVKHNLYSKVFAFKRKDYLKYIRKEIDDLRSMLLVFDIELPQFTINF